ncbi:MAG: amidase [Candidatus Tectomicrobia bacterium]|uniref:Amidase n=1 Tax=Tectimicrobiota bacterium TaxID=2528274 RepID=A0A932I3L1_UNCTE|nr:amidase [Candidatus Tectomicrobia bacterium]
MTDDLCYAPVHELAGRIAKKELSPLDVVEANLKRIEEVNPKVLGFIHVTGDQARKEAKRAGEEIAAGRRKSPLHGIPFGVKDIIDTAGVRTTMGSAFFMDRVPEADAFSVAGLKRAGAILLGKCHTQEFASGPLSHNPHLGTARNPWDLSRITGGSSTGSAASVASGMAPAALGTDTGSSIRGPATHCGIVGLKPTHGRVSLSGVCPNALSYDHVGPLARTVRDAALVLQAIAGYDPADPYSRDVPVPDFSADLDKGVKGMRLALCPDLCENAEVDAEIQLAFDRAVGVLRELGARVETLPFSEAKKIRPVNEAIMSHEFIEFHRPLYAKDPSKYGDFTRKRIEDRIGKGDPDAFIRAQRQRELLRRAVLALFERADILLTPGLPCIAPSIDTLKSKVNGKEIDYSLSVTQPFLTHQNMTGFPALVVPTGLSAEGLPMSIQFIGPPWEEGRVLRAGQAYEEATPELRNRRPPV